MIGIKDQFVEYPTQLSAIEYKLIELDNDGKFYLILDDTFSREGVNKINPLLKDDEIFGTKIGDETIFTYIIGTQIEITKDKQLIRDIVHGMERECDIKNMHIWAKLALSKQEINTKHNSILNDSYVNYLNIESSILNKTKINETDEFNGIIDRIFYAGELKIDKNNNVYINFLSGTFMDRQQIPCDKPPEDSKKCIDYFLKQIGATSVTIDTSCKTFIDKQMTRDLLNQYVNTGMLKVGVFNNKKDALDYARKKIDLAKLQNQIISKKRSKFINQGEINKLEQTYNDLLNNNFNMIEYNPLSGGEKNKTKRRRFYKSKKGKSKKGKSKKSKSKKVKRVNY
jgi:hypothetical protein